MPTQWIELHSKVGVTVTVSRGDDGSVRIPRRDSGNDNELICGMAMTTVCSYLVDIGNRERSMGPPPVECDCDDLVGLSTNTNETVPMYPVVPVSTILSDIVPYDLVQIASASPLNVFNPHCNHSTAMTIPAYLSSWVGRRCMITLLFSTLHGYGTVVF